MKSKILFVTEKWCEHPSLGFTHNFHNYFHTISQYGETYSTLHIDESAAIFGRHIDEVLVDYCFKYNIGVIFFSLLGNSRFNPSIQVLQQLKSMGIYLVFFWHDVGPGWAIETIGSLQGIANLHLAVDNSSYEHELLKADNFLTLWTPENPKLYYPQAKDIKASFIGSDRYPDRKAYLRAISMTYPWVVIGGGQREQKLSLEKYAELIRRSEIGLNFSGHALGFSQTKGRVFEIIGSESLLIENKNSQTAKLFTPGVDYVEFEGEADLLEKLAYYSANKKERAMIAHNGYQKYLKQYTAWHFWDLVLNRIKKDFNEK